MTWVDATKGICILLVVLFHATLVDATPPASGPWWAINAVFATLRMPLFFLASGLFAASVLQRSWREVLTGRVLLLVYVYLLWLTLRRAYFGVLGGGIDLTWQDYVLPDSDMWFLYVLAVFFVLGRALRTVPAAVALPAAAVLSVAAGTMTVQRELYRFDDMAIYFVFFLAGCHWSVRIRREAARIGLTHVFVACATFLALTLAVTAADLRDVPPFRFVVTVAALAAGLTVAVLLDRTRVGALLTFVGRRSMPVYVLHMIFMRTTVHIADALQWDVQGHVLGPLLLWVPAVGGPLAVYAVLRNVPGLFEVPGWLQRAVAGPPRASKGHRSVPEASTSGAPATAA